MFEFLKILIRTVNFFSLVLNTGSKHNLYYIRIAFLKWDFLGHFEWCYLINKKILKSLINEKKKRKIVQNLYM